MININNIYQLNFQQQVEVLMSKTNQYKTTPPNRLAMQ